MLVIKNAELLDQSGKSHLADVTISEGIIQKIESGSRETDGTIIDACGCLLLPGINDHHMHFASYAASIASVYCGPPTVNDEAELINALDQPGSDWLRGIGFHESVLPELSRQWLDKHGPERAIRIQHRTGRLWIVNSLGLEKLEAASSNLEEHERARLTSTDGHLYDVDELLSTLTRNSSLPVREASQTLASFGVTGFNDMTASNDQDAWQWFSRMRQSGELKQRVRLSGKPELSRSVETNYLHLGETKIHLHESSLPDFSYLVETICRSHEQNRAVAVHCVTEVELVFTLSALRTAGAIHGDRIEHASVIPPLLIEQLLEMGLGVVTQPNFVSERGDAYLDEIPESEHSFLYRIRSLKEAEVPLALATDSPFGNADPWASMHAAVTRKTPSGRTLCGSESITPFEALQGFIGNLKDPFRPVSLAPGQDADLCLLDYPWSRAGECLSSAHVRLTIVDGKIVYNSSTTPD